MIVITINISVIIIITVMSLIVHPRYRHHHYYPHYIDILWIKMELSSSWSSIKESKW